jgi:hypothetical protein
MHVPKVQTWFAPQAMQVKPELPQACALLPVWQVPAASQQPLVHVDDEHAFVGGPPQAVTDRTTPDSRPMAKARIMSAQRSIFGRGWRVAGALSTR